MIKFGTILKVDIRTSRSVLSSSLTNIPSFRTFYKIMSDVVDDVLDI